MTFFNHVMDFFFKLLIFFVVLVLAIGFVRLFWDVWTVMAGQELKEAFAYTVTHLLTFFIILELFKSLVEYFREHRLKLTFIIDATLVFILREVMIGLYQHQSLPAQIAALALMVLVLGAVRTLAIIYSPMEHRLVEKLQQNRESAEPANADANPSRNLLAPTPVQ
ncbi:MAG: phosphate-starvation-inducible PsiE family protein [Candidatus Binatia bacterium]